MLDVSLGELMRRGPQEMLPGELAPRGHQGDDVLELVAEPVGAAGLVERRPRPQPARQRLVEEPAVEHDVHRAVGRPHLDRALGVVPVARHAAQRRLVVGRSPAPDEVGRRRGPVRLAEQHEDLGPRPVGELEAGLQGGARIQAGADGSLQPVARGPGRRAGPDAPLRPRNSVRSAVHAVCRPPRSRKATRPPNSVFHGLRTRSALRLRLQRRDDPGGAGPARGAQRPLGVGGHRQAPGAPGSVLDGQHRDLQAGRRAGRTGRGRARCRRGGARTGCIRRRDGRRTSIPRSGSAGPSDPTARRCRRRGRRSPRSPGR